MHLKQIELWGFKSFADRTLFEFGEGVFGIVGPNGCGKSNVADAFRWVMGEQSAKSLRGERMQDVIFAGTAKRKGSSFAQVTLTFTTSSREVTLSRRLDRSGESEYRLNGKVARLKEIQSLFLDSGVGKEAYAIFEQGRMDEIVFRSPEERRPIFEQAAGIHRYRKQWQEAVAKLEQAKLNCSRVADVLQEVAKQLKVLEKQVGEARQFKDNQERLQALEQGLIIAKWKGSEVQRERSIGELNPLLEQQEEGKRGDLAFKEALSAGRQKAASFQKRFQSATEELYRLRSQREVGAVEELSARKRVQEIEERQKRLQGEALHLKTQLSALHLEDKEKINQIAQEVANLEKQCASLREQVQKVHALRLERIGKAHELQTQLKERTVRHESAIAQIEAISRQLERICDKCKGLQGSNAVADLQLQELIEKFHGAKRAWKETEGELASIALALETGQKNFEQAQMDLAQALAKEQLLRRLQEEQEGLSSVAKQLLKEEKFKGKIRPYGGTLLIEPAAVLTAVGKHAQTLGLSGLSITAGKGRLKVGDFGPIRMCSTEEESVLFLASEEELSVFTREAELQQLVEWIQTKGQEKEKWLQETVGLKKRQAELLEKRSIQDREHRLLEMKQVEVNFGLQQGKKELEELTARQGLLDQELKQHFSSSWALEEECKRLEMGLKEACECLEGEQVSSLTVEAQLKEKMSAFAEAEKRYRHLSVLIAKEEQYLLQQKRVEEESKGLSSSLEALQTSLESLTLGAASIQEALKEGQKRCDAFAAEARREQGEVAKLESQARKGEVFLQQLQEKVHRLEVSIAAYSAQVQSHEEELLKRFGLRVIDVQGFPIESLEEGEKEVKKLKHILEATQTVNFAAIEEHQACQERYTHLSTQMSDLDRSRTELETIIEELDKLSKEQFLMTFEKIRESFQRQFQILFNGGEADLQFVGSLDPLEAGIDLVAKPPGKKMRSIKLLSGGEKCLTAMALLFALFEVKPAPYCLFDEIDAPLDDANVGRFLALLNSFKERTQVIIITHNKLTMAQADVLYGVTMEEQGVSKQIAMRFEPKGELALI